MCQEFQVDGGPHTVVSDLWDSYQSDVSLPLGMSFDFMLSIKYVALTVLVDMSLISCYPSDMSLSLSQLTWVWFHAIHQICHSHCLSWHEFMSHYWSDASLLLTWVWCHSYPSDVLSSVDLSLITCYPSDVFLPVDMFFMSQLSIGCVAVIWHEFDVTTIHQMCHFDMSLMSCYPSDVLLPVDMSLMSHLSIRCFAASWHEFNVTAMRTINLEELTIYISFWKFLNQVLHWCHLFRITYLFITMLFFEWILLSCCKLFLWAFLVYFCDVSDYFPKFPSTMFLKCTGAIAGKSHYKLSTLSLLF